MYYYSMNRFICKHNAEEVKSITFRVVSHRVMTLIKKTLSQTPLRCPSVPPLTFPLMTVCWFDWLLTSTDTRINIQYPTHLSVKSSAACCLEGIQFPWDWGFCRFNIRSRSFTIHLSILMHDWKCHIKLLCTLISQVYTYIHSWLQMGCGVELL